MDDARSWLDQHHASLHKSAHALPVYNNAPDIVHRQFYPPERDSEPICFYCNHATPGNYHTTLHADHDASDNRARSSTPESAVPASFYQKKRVHGLHFILCRLWIVLPYLAASDLLHCHNYKPRHILKHYFFFLPF